MSNGKVRSICLRLGGFPGEGSISGGGISRYRGGLFRFLNLGVAAGCGQNKGYTKNKKNEFPIHMSIPPTLNIHLF